MQRIIILGGGGFGRELHGYLSSDISLGHLPGFIFGGVLDNDPNCELVRASPEILYLGSLANYQSSGDEHFISAVGAVKSRRSIAKELKERNLRPFTYVHSSVLMAPDAHIGQGSIVCPFSIVNSGASIADHVAINVFCSVGHGARVGEFSVLSPYSSLSGNARLGANCFMGTRATMFPGVETGDSCIIDSHSYVKASVPDRKMVSTRGQYLVVDNRLGA